MTADVNLSQLKKNAQNRGSVAGIQLRRFVLTKGNKLEINLKRPD